MFDIVSVGHLSIDSIFLPSRKSPFIVLGGPVAYVSLAATRLNARTSVISKIGADFPAAYKWWLEQEGIDLSGLTTLQQASTTRFELRYDSGLSNRSISSDNRMSPISVEDLPNPLKAKIVHLAPIAGEVSLEVAKTLRNYAQVLSLDPQGLLRNFDERGNVTLGQPVDMSILGLIDVFKSSLEEIQVLTGLPQVDAAIRAVHSRGPRVVIVTLGDEGAVVSVRDIIHTVPAYKPEKLVDPTGAGDAFIGGFLAEYARGEGLSWCSLVGSAAASLVVEGTGPTSLGEREEVYRRARFLHEKEIKE